MATETHSKASVQSQPLVKITEMDHIVLRNKDVEDSLRFYTEVLGLQAAVSYTHLRAHETLR